MESVAARAILDRLDGVRAGHGGQSTARCPAHDDRTASLSVSSGRDGRALLHCHAGCLTADIVAALSLEMSDLRPDGEEQAEGLSIVATYDYRDRFGQLVYQVLRLEPKTFRRRAPNGDWSTKGIARVPYRLPELLSSPASEPVVIVEGEKDADRLAAGGMVATTACGGAGKRWPMPELLSDRFAAIIPDNDDAGRAHANAIRGQLEAAGARVVLQPLNVPPKGDVSDWLDSGRTCEELRSKLAALAAENQPTAFRSSCSVLGNEREQREAAVAKMLGYGISYLDEVTRGLLPHDLILLGAYSGAGKTQIATLIAQSNARLGKRVHYLVLEAEPGEIERRMKYSALVRLAYSRSLRGCVSMTYADWYVGKYKAIESELEAEVGKTVSEEVKTLSTFYRSREFSIANLVKIVESVKDQTDLVVIDHLHYIDSDDDNDNRAFRSITKGIRDLSLRIGVPVVVVAHLRKKDRGVRRIIPDIDDFHGTSEIVKIATRVILMAPAYDMQTVNHRVPTYMHVCKDRVVGRQNIVALLEYNLRSGTYLDGYGLGRLTAGGEKWEELSLIERPGWAVSARSV